MVAANPLSNAELSVMSKEGFYPWQGIQGRKKDIIDKTAALIAHVAQDDPSRLHELIVEIAPNGKSEVGVMAQVIVTKALDEPQHSQACVSLSSALRETLPTLPSIHQRSKAENFMHALLDAFQTEFENLFAAFPNLDASSKASPKRNETRLKAILKFAGHLYHGGLLGNCVVAQMVEDLVTNGEGESANELLWSIGVATNGNNQNNAKLGTIVE